MRSDYDAPPRLPDGETVPLDDIIAGDGPFELEIGPGRGRFIVERCQRAPEVRIMGLEIKRKWSCLVDQRLAREGFAERARVFCEDVRLALPRLGPDAGLDRVFVHFPDPWWKKRHRKRLVLSDRVLDELSRLLRDDGELFIQTDVAD
jgi:tRNA (guanine-N7-)-methyltransferase